MCDSSLTSTMKPSQYSWVDFLFTCLGLVFLVFDIVLDVLAVVSLYQERDYRSLCVLLLFLVGSSVLVQAFSWLWYSYEDYRRETTVEKCLSVGWLKLLHVLQLGIYIRHAGVVEVSVRSFLPKKNPEIKTPGDFAVYLSHDLSMLRLLETFSESAPQLVLMLTIMLQRGQLDHWTVLKALGSASAIACSVTMYHRSLRFFLKAKQKQQFVSSVVYFLWNLLLIMSRITALALFASVLPCFILTHFICSWIILFFFVWRSKTDFMDNAFGEWLYRATVGLIWYFDWFNVVEGKTRNKTLLYHGYMLADISLLCSLWCWKIITDPPYFEFSPFWAKIIAVSVVSTYILGLFSKMIYYKFFHPKLNKDQLKGGDTESSSPEPQPTSKIISADMPDAHISMVRTNLENSDMDGDIQDRSLSIPASPDTKRYNKRMKKLAENFYS
ncbi:XK-related protein 8 [Notolabrus celidotus]|uniref:XK-related protein 8 n=1 Tax=Notolabrus celidotus TaxID=1203425 RepID=UPI00148F9457|nr:XK-related protein 8 [Notolabrus celidotus]